MQALYDPDPKPVYFNIIERMCLTFGVSILCTVEPGTNPQGNKLMTTRMSRSLAWHVWVGCGEGSIAAGLWAKKLSDLLH